jgi:Xaa-Pro aminopeptidase
VRLAPRDTLAVRHKHLHQAVQAANLDGLIVTHLPNLFYLTNFVGTAGMAVAVGDRLYLIVDFRYGSAAQELAASPYGSPDTEIVPFERSYDETLVALVKKLQAPKLGVEGANLSITRFNQLSTTLGSAATLTPTDGLIETLRIVKDAHEVEMLRRGALLLSAVALDVIREVKPGITEQEFAAKIDFLIKSAGFERCSFETIVASGPNSARPHAHAGERLLQAGDLVVLDFGGVYGGYCVDLTRTVSLGDPNAEQQRVYDAVLEAQQAAISAVKPGVRAGDVDAAARGTLGRHKLAEAFGHSTGHGLGIEIHELPRIGPRLESRPGAPAAPDAEIERDMVFTIEPGAYVPGWGGVRIEDDVLVTADGVEVLTNVPRILRPAATPGILK